MNLLAQMEEHTDRNSSTLLWSASFYPQPISNWRRKSTYGLAIDFPTINTLGFVCYTISTSAFLYSSVIREQYAARHLSSPEPTVQFNDLAFAFHAVLLTVVTYSQFFPSLWGFKVGRFQHVSRPMAGIVCGGILAVVFVTLIVLIQSSDGGYNPTEWAWIDVVSSFLNGRHGRKGGLIVADLRNRVYQAGRDVCEIHTSGLGQLQA
jgi:cystinosin